MLILVIHRYKMQEAMLFVLKQVLDEFRTYDKVMDVDAARIFLDHIRASMQDSKYSHSPIRFTTLSWLSSHFNTMICMTDAS